MSKFDRSLSSSRSSYFAAFRHLFFFSSRRRHTRWPRDWSSDVCSSDLERALARRNDDLVRRQPAGQRVLVGRSEERRVGKECRSRRAPNRQKKKKLEKLLLCGISPSTNNYVKT